MATDANLRGVQMDEQTRCTHYQQLNDVIALKHFCCDIYYPCHLCHSELTDHPAQPWPADLFDQPAVLCGVCRLELTVNEYRAVSSCPECQALFNPGCKLHENLYFELPS